MYRSLLTATFCSLFALAPLGCDSGDKAEGTAAKSESATPATGEKADKPAAEGAEAEKPDAEKPDAEKPDAEKPDAAAPPSEKLNLNTASKEQFKTIPEVGDRMAHEFDEYRPYVSIQQFRKEMAKYVEAPQIAGYEKYVFVPIDPNGADAETLKQIPGLDDAMAKALMDARPFPDNAAFSLKLAEIAGPDAAAAAANMLAPKA